MTKIILFDVSGVLVEFTGGPSTLLGDIPNPWAVWVDSPAVRCFESGRCRWEEFSHALIEEMCLAGRPDELYAEFASWPARLVPGAVDLVSELGQAGYHVATLSNTNPVHWPRIIHHLRLHDYISDHFPSHITGCLKPKHSAFLNVINYYGCDPKDITFFDDNRVNVESARALGMDAFEARSLAEIMDLVEELGVLAYQAVFTKWRSGRRRSNEPEGAHLE